MNFVCSCSRPMIAAAESVDINMVCLRRGVVIVTHGTNNSTSMRVCGAVRASMVDSYESSSDFSKRMEQAWLISQQPRPVSCTSCDSNGHVECQWCRGTGYFILGDNMLCQVPSRNTTCVICAGRGQCAALIVKELAFAPGGWGSLRSPSNSTVMQL